MVTIDDIDQPQKQFKVNRPQTFNITGQGLDIVTTADQVRLCTSTELRTATGNKKLAWGMIKLQGQPTSTTIGVHVHLKALDVQTKPIGGILRFFIWLWALVRGLWPRDPTGDLTITITDTNGEVVAAKAIAGVTYQS